MLPRRGYADEQLRDVNAEINPGQSDEDHYEGIYYGGGAGPLVVEHDTIIDPHDQTAAIFVSHDLAT